MNTQTGQPTTILSKLPCVDTLESIFKLKAFLDTPDGSGKYNKWSAATKTYLTVKKIAPVAVLAVIIGTIYTRYILHHLLAVFVTCVVILLIRTYFKDSMERSKKKYLSARWQYACELAEKIVAIIGGYYYIFPETNMFFYNDKMCFYIDARQGALIGYNKECIKQANIEHAQLGSTTMSTAYTKGTSFNAGIGIGYNLDYIGGSTFSATTSGTANTRNFYEWKLDILTNFLDRPHITMVFPDTKNGEAAAKRACALLS